MFALVRLPVASGHGAGTVRALELAAGVVERGGEPAELANLVVKLGEGRSGSLRDGLSQALGDPTLEVGQWLPEGDRVVDAAGDELALRRTGSERAVTLVERPGVGWRRSCTTRPCSTTPCSWEPFRVGRARLHRRAAARTDGRPARAAPADGGAPHRSGRTRPISTSGRTRTKRLRRLGRPDRHERARREVST